MEVQSESGVNQTYIQYRNIHITFLLHDISTSTSLIMFKIRIYNYIPIVTIYSKFELYN